MTSPTLVSPRALEGLAVGVSVSESADLPRLGLTESHCALAVAELARAVILAGGTIVYGGRIFPSGFTDILLGEAQRYTSDDRSVLTHCVPYTEHASFSHEFVQRYWTRLGTRVNLVLLDQEGRALKLGAERSEYIKEVASEPEVALTAARRFMAATVNARVVVGGKLSGFQGVTPGILEESLLTVQKGDPLYAAGGFGGAAAVAARALNRDNGEWAPPGYPAGADDPRVVAAAEELARAWSEGLHPDDGLTNEDRSMLATTHRAGDIANLSVRGLAERKP